MGQRANLLIVSGGSCEMYYTHHRANTLDHDLFWGPDYALGFIRAQRRVDADERLDDVWAEGGAVLDLDRRSLLWFGGEDVLDDVPLRRVHSELMAHIWSGWTVEWAPGGVADMADAVGWPRASVLSEKNEPPASRPSTVETLHAGDDPEWCNTLASARLASGEIRVSRLPGDCQELLYDGAAIVPALEASGWPSRLALDWTGDYRQSGGFHVDVAARAIDFWTADPFHSADVERRVRDCWPGWVVRWHGHRFESQVDRTGGNLTVRIADRARLVEQRRQWLLRPDADLARSGAEAIVSAARLINGQTDMTVTGINPVALYDARLSLPLAIRTRLFDAAVAAMSSSL